jgi:transketolase
MIATRDGFGEQLAICGKDNEKIIVLGADLSHATKCSVFQDKFPNRFFEIGIAEANCIGIASGLSEYGYRVFISSFASFLTGRYDIIRCSLAYSNANVVVVGTHSGMAIGRDGVTQMGLEDVNVMRGLPGIQILQPATPLEARLITKYLCETGGLSYLRLGRQPVEEVFDGSYKFVFGKGSVIKTGNDIAIFSSGCVLTEVLDVAKRLDAKGFYTSVINISVIKPIDKDLILETAQNTGMLVSVEDHSIIGGLGTAISEVLTDNYPKKLLRIGLSDIFPESGKPNDLYEKYGLSVEKIFNRILKSK